MKDSARDERPLDHTTARIVAELAAALLPRLREAVTAELLRAAESAPQRTDEGVEEMLLALKSLKNTAEETAALLGATQRSLEQTTSGVLSRLERLPDLLEAFVAQVRDGNEQATENRRLLETLQRAMPAWEGVLRADGRAHTRELSELSSEVSEVLRDARADLSSAVKETMEKESEKRGERLEELLREHRETLTRRVARFEKIVAAVGLISAIVCAAAVSIGVMLFR
ncbi:MAG: hypothetical protein LBQ90_02845 [Synergistaceae bacterium]|jgi:hypothetical protein|nr:hypothetical protein [Synergistaceae bacterium]